MVATSNTDMENEEHPPRESGPKQKIQLRLCGTKNARERTAPENTRLSSKRRATKHR